MSPIRPAFAAIFAAAAIGCGGGDGLERRPISGTVSLDGKPLERGLIQFFPTTDQQPVASGGIIEDGRFSVPQEQGPTPGTYRVSITASSADETATAPDESPGSGVPARELIPARYNAKSNLTAEVTTDGDNAFEYPLTSK